MWLPWLMGAAVACVVLFGWQSLNRREEVDIERSTLIVRDWLQTAMVRDLSSRMSSLQRISDRWSRVGGTLRPDWEADVTNYLAHQPGYDAIVWVDAALKVQWIMPRSRSQEHRWQDLIADSNIPERIRAAQAAGSSTIAPAMQLGDWNSSFFAYYPVARQGDFDGLIIAVFEFDTWFDSLLNSSTKELFDVQVLMDGQVLHDTATETNPVDEARVKVSTFTAYGRQWTLRVWLSGSRLGEYRSLLSEGLLVMGLLVSVMLAWTLQATLESRMQSHRLQLHTRRLEAQWKNLPGMAYRSTGDSCEAIDFISDGCLELTGFSKADFQLNGIGWDSLVHAEDQQRRRDVITQAADTRQSYRCEYRIVCNNGEVKWVWERGNIINADDEDSRVIEGLVLDVTEQKQTEVALTDAIAYAGTVVETAAEAIVTISTHGEIEAVNRSTEDMFGYGREELIGENVSILMPEPYASAHDDYLGNYMRTGEKHIIGIGREVRGRRKDGTDFPIQLSVSEFVTKGERKFVGLIRDLTQQQQAEQEARLHRERLAHVGRVNMLGEMATGIAHEINQPLSAISMYAQSGLRLLDADVPRPERLRDALEKLSVQAHRAGAVIERMQQFARQRDSQHEEIDCNQLMQQVAHLAESEALIREARIRLDLDSNIRKVVGDPVQLQQVALNLLRNGMESMQGIDHQHGNQITLQTRSDQHQLTVSIIDQGTGVSAEAAEQLYKPFASTKEMGMGIGLSICKSIIHSHGGELDFNNHEDQGATFFFTLPYPARESQ